MLHSDGVGKFRRSASLPAMPSQPLAVLAVLKTCSNVAT